MPGPLGRLEPTDWAHVDKYPLSAVPQPRGVPVIIGVNWYDNFDYPEQDSRGRWWVGRGELGPVRGGHAVVLKPFYVVDPVSWWLWHNQVSEGICVSEAVVRAMALLNRKRYQPRPVYDWAQRNDEWPGTDYEGTSVRAGLDCARTQGLVPALRREPHFTSMSVGRSFNYQEGIAANRWATSVDEVLGVLDARGRDYVPLLNSWGRDYPHIVYMPAATLDRLRRENGEVGLVTDR